MANIIDWYAKQIRKIPRLNQKEELELVRRIKEGDPDAELKFQEHNLRLVLKIAHDYKKSCLSLIELVSEGNLGLLRAVQKYDPRKGKFSVYAGWWIRNKMEIAVEEYEKQIRIPRAIKQQRKKAEESREKLSKKLKRNPTLEEISKDTGISKKRIKNQAYFLIKQLNINKTNLEEGEDYSETLTNEESPTPYQALMFKEKRKKLIKYMESLSEREKQILIMRNGLNGEGAKTLREISEIYGITHERVRQIQKKIETELKIKYFEEERESKEKLAEYNQRS